MAVYPVSTSDRTEPLDEPERTPLEWMDECDHRGACERCYRELVDGREFFGWEDEMARRLGCADCECWEG